MTIYKYDMKCLSKTAEMCSVTITQRSWLILGQKILFSSPLFAQLQPMKTSDYYNDYTPSVDKPKTGQKISVMCTYFRVVMETCFE